MPKYSGANRRRAKITDDTILAILIGAGAGILAGILFREEIIDIGFKIFHAF